MASTLNFMKRISSKKGQSSNNCSGNNFQKDLESLSISIKDGVNLIHNIPFLSPFCKVLIEMQKYSTELSANFETITTNNSKSTTINLLGTGNAKVTPENYIQNYILRVKASVEDNLSSMRNFLAKLNQSTDIDVLKRTTNELNKKNIQLSLLYNQLRTFLPQGENCGFNWKFRCAKKEAEDWWSSNFHNNIYLEWEEFMIPFKTYFKLENPFEAQEIQLTINFCNSDYVSKYEFDLFTRLFCPWSKLIDVWKAIVVDHPGYIGMATYEEAKERLKDYNQQVGSYLFRFSSTKFGLWSIAYVKEEGLVSQVLLRDRTLIEALVQGGKKRLYLRPFGRNHNPDLSHLLEAALPINLDDVYDCNFSNDDAGFDDAHEMCKICFERCKDTQLEPCLHYMCRFCVNEWMNRGETCPYCRTSIRSIRRVQIERKTENPSPNNNNNNNNNVNSQNSPKDLTSGPSLPPRPMSVVSTTTISNNNNDNNNSFSYFNPTGPTNGSVVEISPPPLRQTMVLPSLPTPALAPSSSRNIIDSCEPIPPELPPRNLSGSNYYVMNNSSSQKHNTNDSQVQ